MRSTEPAFLFYSTFVCVTVYFQYHQHLKVIRHICRWNMFLWIHLSAHTLNADFTWVYSSPLGLPRSFDRAISTASCGVLAVAGFCGNGNELMAYTKAVKLLTSRSTSALFLFFSRKVCPVVSLLADCVTSDHAHTKLQRLYCSIPKFINVRK